MVTQKTWIDLLGSDATGCYVYRHYIFKDIGSLSGRMIWAFDTPEEASACFTQWKKEIADRL